MIRLFSLAEQQAQVFEQLAEELQAEQALKASLDLIDLFETAQDGPVKARNRLCAAKQLSSRRCNARPSWHESLRSVLGGHVSNYRQR